jgi:hypothetical protein
MTECVDNFPDCLVFKFEEVESQTNQIDTTLYILYDKCKHKYIIRGRRRITPTCDSCTYSFECEFAKDLVDFIQYIFCPSNTVNELLYNYDNLPNDSNEITYEFLRNYDHSDYEISGYNVANMKRQSLLKNLRMLRNIHNYYL